MMYSVENLCFSLQFSTHVRKCRGLHGFYYTSTPLHLYTLGRATDRVRDDSKKTQL